jgi:O-antigen/teichoic acid export membrane protein
MFISVVSAVVGQWLIRKKHFSLTAKVMVKQSFFINMIKAGLGIVHPTAAILIVTNTLGMLLSASMMLLGLRNTHKDDQEKSKGSEPWSSTWDLAKRYSDFPFLRAPQVLLNSVSQSLPVVMLAAYYGPTSAGFYSIAIAVLGLPVVLIGNSVMQVFYPRINEAIHSGEDAKALIIKATIGLALSGVLPFAVVILVGPTLFGFVFGSEWHIAGTYAQWLSIWLFFQYINKPAVSAIPALRLQRGLLIYELFSTGTKVLALYLGYSVFKSDVAAVALFSFFGVVAYAWLILWVIFHSGKLPYKTQSIQE